MYRKCIDLFNKGDDWEDSIKILDILKNHASSVLFDYKLASALLKEQAELYQKVATSDRFYHTYFLLSACGVGHDEEYKNKEFIYKVRNGKSVTLLLIVSLSTVVHMLNYCHKLFIFSFIEHLLLFIVYL